MALQIRRGTEAERIGFTPLIGELIYVTDTDEVYIGDGTTPGGIPVSKYTADLAKDAAGASLENGTHIGLEFTYDPITKLVSGSLTDPGISEVAADSTPSLGGSLNLNDNAIFGDGSIDINGNIQAPVFKLKSFADTNERDTIIENPEPGMMIFILDDGTGPKFQGYVDAISGWVNLN